jgi:SAM-dependent methyltransferase
VRRLQLVELHDLAHFPAAWRDPFTDFMAFYAERFRPYARVIPILAHALRNAGAQRLLDLGSGGGAAVLALKPGLDAALDAPVRVTLTDKHPNLAAFEAAAQRCPGQVDFVADPVDATAVPDHLDGFRTLLGSLHHFPPDLARSILRDAVRQRRGLAVLEYTERRLWLWALPLLATPLLIWCVTPFIRPMRVARLVWTYLLPVVPLVAVLDGLVSVLRSYTPDELLALTTGLDEEYRWTVGQVRAVGASRATYLVGVPEGR